MFYILIFFLGAGISQVLSDSSEEVNDSQMSASALNRRWLKSKSAGQDLSFRSVNENEEPDSPNIPSDFDAKYGLDKTRFKRTPYPILSRRASYEDYGRAPDQGESIKTDEISFDFSSSKSDKVSSAKPKMTLQSTKETISTKKVAKTLKTLEKSIKPTAISVFLTTRQSNPINEAKDAVSQPKLQSKGTKVTQKLEAIKEKDVLKPMQKPKTDSEFGKEKNNIPPKVDFNKIQTASSAVITLQPKHHPKTQLEVKPPTQSAAEGKTSVSNQENPKLPKSPLQTALPEVKTPSNNTVHNTTANNTVPPTGKTSLTTSGSKIKQIAQESLSYVASHLFKSQQKINPITTNPSESYITEQPSNLESIMQKVLQNPPTVEQSPKIASVKERDTLVYSKQQTLNTQSPSLKTQNIMPKPPLVQKLTLKPVPPQQQTSKPVSSQQETPKQGSSQQQTPKPDFPQQQTPKPASSQQQTPKPVSSQQQTPKPASSQQQTPKPASSQQQTPKPVSSQQQSPKPASSQQQTPKPVSSQQQTPKPASSQQQTPNPVSSQQQVSKPISPKQQVSPQQQTPKPVHSQQQTPKPASSQQQIPNPISSQQQPSQASGIQQETAKTIPPPPQPQVSIKPIATQTQTFKPTAALQSVPNLQQPAKSSPQPPIQQTIKPGISQKPTQKLPDKVEVVKQPTTQKKTPQTLPSQPMNPKRPVSNPHIEQQSQMPTKSPQTQISKPVSPTQKVTVEKVTLQLTTVKVPLNQNPTFKKMETAASQIQVSSIPMSNPSKQPVTKSLSNQQGTCLLTSKPKQNPSPATAFPAVTSKLSEDTKISFPNPAQTQITTKLSHVQIKSSDGNPNADEKQRKEATGTSPQVTKNPIKVQPVEILTSRSPNTHPSTIPNAAQPTEQVFPKSGITQNPAPTQNQIITTESVATQTSVPFKLLVTKSQDIPQQQIVTEYPVKNQQPVITQLPTVKLTKKLETQEPVLTGQTGSQPQKQTLTGQPSVTQPSILTQEPVTSQLTTEYSSNTQPSDQITHPVVTSEPEVHPKTQKPSHHVTHSSSVQKTLKVASSKKKTTVRAYDKILNKAGDMLKPKPTHKTTTEKGISMSQTIQGSTEKEELFPPTSTQITEFQAPLTTSPVTEFHMVDFVTSPSGIDTTPIPTQEVHTIPQAMQQTVSQNSPQHVPQKPSIHSETLEAKEDEAALPKLIKEQKQEQLFKHLNKMQMPLTIERNRPKGRRTPGRIVLKPPPEDWPQPEGLQGAKEIPVPPEFTAKIPPMGTSVDSGKRKSGFKAESFVSPPYMGHRKIDLVPIPERPSTINKETNETIAPSMKWKIRGRKSRPTYGAYQRPGLSVSLTMKPSVSQFFISDNFTFVTPSARSTRQFRTYINFRQRGPMNVGRFFGPPPPPQPFPQPPPQHFHNHPFNQAPFPQHPQYPQPPFPVFPRGPPPPPPHFRPPPHPRFGQGRAPPPFAPPPPFPQGPPPPPPHFQRGPPPPPQFGPPPAQPFQPPLPPGPLPSPLSDVPAPPPSPYPTGVIFPTVRPFYENIPTISPIDNVPAPWPRRQVFMGTFQPKTFVPRNFSAYRGPRRGKAYEQFGKADLRPKKIRGSGFGMEFQTDVTRGPYVPGPMFMRKTWPTRENRFGYEPYRRSSDRKRPFGGFGRYGGEKPPVLGDFGQFKPYRRLDFGPMKSVYNFSRPTRSYTFPPRLRMAIRNATYQRRSFRRFDRDRFDRQSLGHIPSGTAKSYGLADNIAHDHAHYGNLITRKGRIMNLEDLRRLFTAAPIEPEPVLEGVEAVEEAPVVEAMESLTATPIVEAMKMVTAARLEGLDSEIVTVLPEETVNKILEEWMKGKPQAGSYFLSPTKPVGMTAKEALRAAAREAIRDAEKEAYDRGETIGGGLGRRRKGGFRPRGERGRRRSRGSGGFRFGTGARNFRRAKRSVDEDEGFLERQKRVRRELRLDYISESGDYLTGPGARSRSSSSRGDKKEGDAPLRMRRFHRRRGKGRPLRWG